MKSLMVAVALLAAGCGAKPPPKTAKLKADLTACRANADNINKRVRELMGEKLKVSQNRDNLPQGYDTSSIDRTLAQIDSELVMRKDSAARMSARCDTIDEKLHAAEMAQPL